MLWKGFQKPKRLNVGSDPAPTDRYSQFSAQPFERGFGETAKGRVRCCGRDFSGQSVSSSNVRR